MANIVLSNHLAALANAAKNYTLAELAGLTLQGGASYSLPTASETLKGGVKVGTGLSMDGDTLNCTVSDGATYSVATTSQAGLMSASDKSKLNNVAYNANNYTLPTASTSTKGGIKVGTGLSMDGDTLNCTITGGASYSIATNTQAGLMSALDKQHLDTLFQDSTDFIDTVLAGVGGIFFPSASTAQDIITYSENFDFLDNKYLKIMNPPDWDAASNSNTDTFRGVEYCINYGENAQPFFGTSDFDTAYRVTLAADTATISNEYSLVKVNDEAGIMFCIKNSLNSAGTGKFASLTAQAFVISSTGKPSIGAASSILSTAGYAPKGSIWWYPSFAVTRSIYDPSHIMVQISRHASATSQVPYYYSAYHKNTTTLTATTAIASLGTSYDDVAGKTSTTCQHSFTLPKFSLQTSGENIRLLVTKHSQVRQYPFLLVEQNTYPSSSYTNTAYKSYVLVHSGINRAAPKKIDIYTSMTTLANSWFEGTIGGCFLDKRGVNCYVISFQTTAYIPKTTEYLIKTLFDLSAKIYVFDFQTPAIKLTNYKLSDIIDEIT